ncbi:MAG: Crossover junction endodeoxyribonuclease RuvC [Firmicutes bacterium ADurb.Bin193]|nr:MAG: Crossover junction endodeoxyribonuclease RuvC [Firmicutes bacterium ADurb.Bin193]
MGIDPGLAIVGFGIIEHDGQRFKTIEYGSINSPAHTDIPARLKAVYDDISFIIEKYKPDEVAVEELFFNTNIKTAIMVGQARGTLILAAANRGIPVFEYTPLQVKQAVTGYGRAEKIQIQQMVKSILALREIPTPDDTADALAVAICHAHSRTLRAITT